MEFKLPDLGENIDSVDVINLLVSEGDRIEPEQPVVEIETDKAVVEVPCPHGGKVTKIHVKKGDKISVGETLLSLDSSDAGEEEAEPDDEETNEAAADESDEREEEVDEAEEEEEVEQKKPQRKSTPAKSAERSSPPRSEQPAPRSSAAPSHDGGTAPAAPSTRRLARELGADLSSISGSGPGGRITRDDVMAAVRKDKKSSTEKAPAATKSAKPAAEESSGPRDAWGALRYEPMSKIRRTIAANMARSAQTIPHVTNFDEADVTELERIRQGSKASLTASDVKLTSLAFVIKAVAHSLKTHAMLNASIDMEEEQIVFKEYVNIGVAVDTERGLVVPVMRDVPSLTIPQIAQNLANLSAKARDTKFSVDDLRGGTFTISNLGAVGGVYSTPIINHPEVGVLLVGRSRHVPVVIEGKVEVRLIMPLSLSYDHRLVDGATAARFLNEVIGYLESPGRLLFVQ